MKKYTGILCFLLCSLAGFAQGLTDAETAFQKGDFATAKKAYEQLLDKAAPAEKLQAQLRLVACEYHLGEFLNAAKTMRSYPLPQDPVWQARFLLYRIYTAQQASGVYRRALNQHEILSAQAADDPAQWTNAQWQEKIDQDYRQLWSLQEALLATPVEQENLILNLAQTDTRRIPTLFDFTVQSWTSYLQNNPTLMPAPLSVAVPSYLDGAARLKEGPHKNTALLSSQLLKTAAELEGPNRQNARLFWKTNFILLPFHSDHFVLENKPKALDVATAQLRTVTAVTPDKPTWWNRLKNYVTSSPQTDYARGYAAYELAQVLFENERYAQSLEMCQHAQKWTASYFTQQCQQLAAQITRVELAASHSAQPVNRQKPQLSLSGKNLQQVFVRVYKTSFDELSGLYKARRQNRFNSWAELTQLSNKDMVSFLSRTPIHTQTVTVPYQEVGRAQTASFGLPELQEGFYVVLMSAKPEFSPETNGVYGWVLNATDLAVFATAAIEGTPADYVATRTAAAKKLNPNVFHIYTVNLRTGQPQPGTPLRFLNGWNTPQTSAVADKNGLYDMPRSITVSAQNNSNNSYSLDVLARQHNSTAYLSNPLYFNFYNEEPVKLFLQTDRPIYRPGQRVHLSVQGFERLPRGLKTLSGLKPELKVTDPNGKTIFTASPRLDGLGNAQTEFTLPENNLLGNYSVTASLKENSRTYWAHHSFSMEEYKRPDYELTLNQPAAPLEYGRKAVLTGTARYYFGAPLQKAKVTYTLKRRDYIPLFYWWWFRPLSMEEQIIAQGQSVTDEKGNFDVSFTPSRREEDEEFANYELEAQVYDESGRVVRANRSYKISAHPHLFQVEFTQGFYDAQKPSPLAKINLTDADGNSVTGKITLTVSLLENRQPQAPATACYNCPSDKPNLDAWYQDFAAQKTVFKQQVTFQQPGEQTVQLPALPEGVYRLQLASEKAAPQKMVFIVANEKSNLLLPDIALMQHATYYPGETLRALVGAGDLQGSKQLEVYQQDNFITHRATLAGQAEVFKLPLTQEHRGGVALRWFGASNYRLHSAQTRAEIPFDNKKLTVRAVIPSATKPGQSVNWNLTVKDAAGKPVNGLVNATVYDKSLDYYAANKPSLQFTQLYSQRNSPARFNTSNRGTSLLSYFPKEPTVNKDIPFVQLPSINLAMMFRAYKNFGRGSGLMMAKAAAPMAMAFQESATADMAETRNAPVLEETGAGAVLTDGGAADAPTDNVQLRTDFSETAYFNSAVPLTAGHAALRFTMPQSLTTWNILGFALDAQADFGGFTASTVTSKDVLLRLQLPRFYREADKGIIQAAVTNQTNRKITAQVSLSVRKDQTNALSAFGITQPVQTLSVPANSTRFATWDITAPADPALYSITAVARNGQESDGEQKTLPVFPGKMRLLASTHRPLKNGTNTLTLDELANVPEKEVELVALTLNPSLALSVLNSMPNLLTSPYKDLVSSLNRYVPLAVVNRFYTTYPQLKQAVKKLPQRTGLTAPWDEQDPLRLQLLQQTPWLRQAQGRQTNQDNIISLFDDKIVSSYLEKELKNIQRFQNGSGAFSWFAGGPDDEYLTLYALQSFGQALAYKASIPEKSAQQALNYILTRIEKRLKQDKGSVLSVSYALYAAYTLSAFPANWEQSAKAKPYIKRWADYADSQFKFMTPLGQIYAAAVYHRLGDDVKANKYLDLVLARLKTDPLTGAYFAPEAQSWLWYNDTLSTQTVTLRTLLEMRPQAAEIDALTQWLLFNRQVNDWTDSKAAAQAVFTLLDVMQAKGALTTANTYQINWAGQVQTRTFEPLDWTEDLQFVRLGKQISPAAYHAQINRKGADVTDFASLNAVYQTGDAQPSAKGVINVERAYFVREKQGTDVKLRPLQSADVLHAGDEVEIHLTLHTDSAFEYVLLQDPKPAGFESPNLLSGWEYQNVSFYREEKDAATNFFINWVPRGTLTLHYTLQPTVSGQLHVLPAQAQSMYAPEYAAHSASASFTVGK